MDEKELLDKLRALLGNKEASAEFYRTADHHPAIAIKEAVLARSGEYRYTYEDMIARGHVPAKKKAYYTEYRPKEILMANKDKFRFATVSVEHTDEQTNPDNFHEEGQVCGVVGDTIRVEHLPDGEIALVGNIALYTRDAVRYMEMGNKETSADYGSRARISDDPKYDFKMVALGDVNSVAITSAGRGGPTVRVRDSVKRAALLASREPRNIIGGFDMNLEAILKLFGITRTTDSKVKLSKIIFDGLKDANKIDRKKNDGADYKAAMDGIRQKLVPELARVTDSANRTQLASLINGVLNAPDGGLEGHEQKISEGIDKLFDTFRTKDEDTLKRTMDELMGNKDDETAEEKAARLKKEEDDKTRTKDGASAASIAYVDQKFEELTAKLPDLLATSVAKLAGIDPEKLGAARTKDTKLTPEQELAAQLKLLVGGEGDDRTLDHDTIDLAGEDIAFLHNF